MLAGAPGVCSPYTKEGRQGSIIGWCGRTWTLLWTLLGLFRIADMKTRFSVPNLANFSLPINLHLNIWDIKPALPSSLDCFKVAQESPIYISNLVLHSIHWTVALAWVLTGWNDFLSAWLPSPPQLDAHSFPWPQCRRLFSLCYVEQHRGHDPGLSLTQWKACP